MDKLIIITLLLSTLSQTSLGRKWRHYYDENRFDHDHRDCLDGKHDHKRRAFGDYYDYNDRRDYPYEEYQPGWRPRSPPTPEEIEACLYACPKTSNYKPVCGTDNVQYANVGRLQCAMICGIDVQLKYSSACPETQTSQSPVDAQIRNDCIQSCPVTTEYNPVCGTNGVSYNNIGRLGCARSCGVAVKLLRTGSCPAQAQPTTTEQPKEASTQSVVDRCIQNCPTRTKYDPVCGSNGQTYNNIGALKCAKRCGVDVSLRRSSSCSKTPSNSNPQDKPASYDNTQDSDIPKELLDSIFTSSAPPPKDDEEIDIDVRIQDRIMFEER